jgi:hypothetical protein
MKMLRTGAVLAVGVLGLVYALTPGNPGQLAAADEDAAGAMLMHDVYFTLKESTPEAKKKLVEACKKYLTKHPGAVAFAAGVRADEFKRPINDQEFDVALHIVFKNKAAHDKYQDSTRHHQFIDEHKESFKQVRVFDAEVTE